MLFKNVFKTFALLGAPLLAYAVDENCANPDKIDTDKCRADILIVTTQERNQRQNAGLESIVTTLERFSIPANQLSVPQMGIKDDEIYRILYSDAARTSPRYKAIVFPNGRVSYANGCDDNGNCSADAMWKSALSWEQWNIITQYSANTNSRIVYLNEYPSNNTGTELAYENFNNYAENQKYSIDQEFDIVPELSQVELNTFETWHYPAKISPEDKNRLEHGFEYVKPMLYFEPSANVPDITVAAVECSNQNALYAGFFTSFGQWSTTAAALNIYWLNWALDTDIEKISEQHISNIDALNMSAAPKAVKLAFSSIAISTIIVIIAALF